jgi:hypothetical protein
VSIREERREKREERREKREMEIEMKIERKRSIFIIDAKEYNLNTSKFNN